MYLSIRSSLLTEILIPLLNIIGNQTTVYTIIAFTLDIANQAMVIFTANRLTDSMSKIKVRQDYASNILTNGIEMIGDIMDEITDDKGFDSAVTLCCIILQEKRNQGKLWLVAFAKLHLTFPYCYVAFIINVGKLIVALKKWPMLPAQTALQCQKLLLILTIKEYVNQWGDTG